MSTPYRQVLWANVWNWTHSGGIASRVHLTTDDGTQGKTLCGKEYPAAKGHASGFAMCKRCYRKAGLSMQDINALSWVPSSED